MWRIWEVSCQLLRSVTVSGFKDKFEASKEATTRPHQLYSRMLIKEALVLLFLYSSDSLDCRSHLIGCRHEVIQTSMRSKFVTLFTNIYRTPLWYCIPPCLREYDSSIIPPVLQSEDDKLAKQLKIKHTTAQMFHFLAFHQRRCQV